MVSIKRGEVWWAQMSEPSGSEPGFRRPILILQSDTFNKSRINTVIAAVITSNARLAQAPGNVALSKKESGLTKESVVNVSQLITLDKVYLTERVSKLSESLVKKVEAGVRLVLSLD